jgi:hypothetical protein
MAQRQQQTFPRLRIGIIDNRPITTPPIIAGLSLLFMEVTFSLKFGLEKQDRIGLPRSAVHN